MTDRRICCSNRQYIAEQCSSKEHLTQVLSRKKQQNMKNYFSKLGYLLATYEKLLQYIRIFAKFKNNMSACLKLTDNTQPMCSSSNIWHLNCHVNEASETVYKVYCNKSILFKIQWQFTITYNWTTNYKLTPTKQSKLYKIGWLVV